MNDDIKEVTENDPDFGYEKEPSWTSIDMYFKGFHVKKSMPNNIKPDDLKKGIQAYIDAGFEPSWNSETNKQNGHTPAVTPSAVPICAIHNKEMVERVGKFGNFWACPTKDAQGNWCKFKPETK